MKFRLKSWLATALLVSVTLIVSFTSIARADSEEARDGNYACEYNGTTVSVRLDTSGPRLHIQDAYGDVEGYGQLRHNKNDGADEYLLLQPNTKMAYYLRFKQTGEVEFSYCGGCRLFACRKS